MTWPWRSDSTVIFTFKEVRPFSTTSAQQVRMSPTRTGFFRTMVSMETVTRRCTVNFLAAMAPAMSMWLKMMPPKMFPDGSQSLGNITCLTAGQEFLQFI